MNIHNALWRRYLFSHDEIALRPGLADHAPALLEHPALFQHDLFRISDIASF
jgi:hypothetical protein